MARRATKKYPALTGLKSAGIDNAALDTYPALQAESNAHYDAIDNQIRQSDPVNNGGSFNQTMALMNNQQSKISPWAPFFQALAKQRASRVGQDMQRPQGLADDPNWWAQGDVGDSAQLPIGASHPLMRSSNMATPAVSALKRYGR